MNSYEKMILLPGYRRQVDALIALKDGLEKYYNQIISEKEIKAKNDFHEETMLKHYLSDKKHNIKAIDKKINELLIFDTTKTMHLLGGHGLIWDGINCLWRVSIV